MYYTIDSGTASQATPRGRHHKRARQGSNWRSNDRQPDDMTIRPRLSSTRRHDHKDKMCRLCETCDLGSGYPPKSRLYLTNSQGAAYLPQRVKSQRAWFGVRRTPSAIAVFGAGGAWHCTWPPNPQNDGSIGPPKVQPAHPDVWKVSRNGLGAAGPLLWHPVFVSSLESCSSCDFWRAFLRRASRR